MRMDAGLRGRDCKRRVRRDGERREVMRFARETLDCLLGPAGRNRRERPIAAQ